jgi:glycosyltransferase involved in cell wall biosynthesis
VNGFHADRSNASELSHRDVGMMPPLVSVVAPLFNEAATLPEFVRRLAAASRPLERRYQFEYILVDDGSTDDSLEAAKRLACQDPRLRVIELRRNFGQTAALQAGLAAARGEIVVSMDSDLQHFPEDLPLFLAKIEEGYDLVCGWRHARKEGVVRRWPSRAANAMTRAMLGLQVHDVGTTFRAYRADLVRHIQLLGEQHRFVPVLATLVGARVTEVPIQNVVRPVGRSNYGLRRTVNVLLDILFLCFSRFYLTRPLKAFGKLALLLMTAGGTIATWLVVYAYVTGEPTVRTHSGWFLVVILLILAGLQILVAGLLAEILVRIYYRQSGTEGYVVRREWNGSTMER